ncbi:phosphopyruvate hydratase [Candidatus Woesearchaeota archaeon]|nr:phosphopyruvate hydratase [Candidatus Woesearchaeota archaeon]
MPDFSIKKVVAREVLDSRGNPTVEAEVFAGGISATAIVPSGASTGKHEALELRDKEKRYLGKGVLKAVENVHRIGRKIDGMDCREQRELDSKMLELDGTPNKKNLGANAILAVSMATAKAAASATNIPLYAYLAKIASNKQLLLPVPFCNVINGGRHAEGKLALQEFMIAPVKAASFNEAIRMAAETYHVLKEVIAKKYGKSATHVGDEGGFAPPIATAEQALDLLTEAVEKAGYASKMKFAIDAAASEFFSKGFYILGREKYLANELQNYYSALIRKYPVISLEDPFDQDDFDAFAKLTAAAGIQIVGDDLLVTNEKRISRAISKNSCNCLLLKVNQIGTVTEAIEAARLAMKNSWKVMVSHRSGETEDSFIADLSVALGCGQIKSGAPCRGERTAKYNQLLRIEEELGKKAKYSGKNF